MIVLSESKHGGAEATLGLADEIHSKLVDGDSFTQMAQVYSDLYADAGGFRPFVCRRIADLHQAQLAGGAAGIGPKVAPCCFRTALSMWNSGRTAPLSVTGAPIS